MQTSRMGPRDIRAELVRKGITMQYIADRLRVRREFVSQVVAGRRSTPRVRRAIAKALGMPETSVFGPRSSESQRCQADTSR
jgi:transcriptional regulator with XRE-family HTH domain